MTTSTSVDAFEMRCRFATARLAVEGWKNQISTSSGRETLAQKIADMLTVNVAKTLPEGWQGVETRGDALDWIRQRSQEGSVSTVQLIRTGELVGLLLIDVAAGSNRQGLRLRLGYFLSESSWGQGLGSELIEGLVGWCRQAGDVEELMGLVEPGNIASVKVLTRNGFESPVSSGREGMLTLSRRF